MEEIDVKKLDVSPLNMRKKTGLTDVTPLADSIESDGLIHPIVVRPKKKGSGFEVVVGQRRFLASKQIGKKKIPARVLNVDDLTALRLSIKENRDSVKPDPIELAEAYAKYRDIYRKAKPEATQKEIALSLGVSEKDYWEVLAINELSAPAKQSAGRAPIAKSDLGQIAANIRELPAKTQKKVIDIIVEKELPRRDTRRFMNGLRSNPTADPEEVYSEEFEKKGVGYTISAQFSAKVSRGITKAGVERDASNEDIVKIAVEQWLEDEGYL